MRKAIDLHVHSNFSDGSYSPQEIIHLSAADRLAAVALCDHDTTAGLKEFFHSAKGSGVKAIGGVEISAEWTLGSCHIVGLNIPTQNTILENKLLQLRNSRFERNEKISKKLLSIGININFEMLKNEFETGTLGRNHIASAMVRKGYVPDIQSAFDKFLAKGKPAYIERFRFSPEEAVAILKDVDALPVIAHPSLLKADLATKERLISKLKDLGLFGIEVYTPYANKNDIEESLYIADKYELCVSGGSDFHGSTKPAHKLGYYSNDDHIPFVIMEQFKSVKFTGS